MKRVNEGFKVMQRNERNPILTRSDIPAISRAVTDVSSVFNPGAVKVADKYLLMLRVQNRGRETFLMLAQSDNGADFKVEEKTVEFKGIEEVKETIYHVYDPRITWFEEDQCWYIMFAMDMDGCCKLGLGRTVDFKEFDFIGIVSDDDNRNGVLFPEKIDGKYVRYDRPNKVELEDGTISGGSICISTSDDLLTWTTQSTVCDGRFHYWDERIGAGPPPVKTEKGWLQLYHGIAGHFGSCSIYQGGVFLTELDNPAKVIARGKYNILEPREIYELTGQVPNVVFPSGMIVEEFAANGFAKPESAVKVYYGAADTVVGLAHTTIQQLLDACFDLQVSSET